MAKKPISRILVSENILSLEECTLLMTLYDRYSELASGRDYNSRALFDYYTLRNEDTESASWVYALTVRWKEKMASYFDTPGLFIESFFIAVRFRAIHISRMRIMNEGKTGDGFLTILPSGTTQELLILMTIPRGANWFFRILISLSLRGRVC